MYTKEAKRKGALKAYLHLREDLHELFWWHCPERLADHIERRHAGRHGLTGRYNGEKTARVGAAVVILWSVKYLPAVRRLALKEGV